MCTEMLRQGVEHSEGRILPVLSLDLFAWLSACTVQESCLQGVPADCRGT